MRYWLSLFIMITMIAGCTSYDDTDSKETTQVPDACSGFGLDNCPAECAICPPCEVCSSLVCTTKERCDDLGFNETWFRQTQSSSAPDCADLESRLEEYLSEDVRCSSLNMANIQSAPRSFVGGVVTRVDRLGSPGMLSHHVVHFNVSGEDMNMSIMMDPGMEILEGRFYMFDKIDECRTFLSYADSRMPSPLLEGFYRPQEIQC